MKKLDQLIQDLDSFVDTSVDGRQMSKFDSEDPYSASQNLRKSLISNQDQNVSKIADENITNDRKTRNFASNLQRSLTTNQSLFSN